MRLSLVQRAYQKRITKTWFVDFIRTDPSTVRILGHYWLNTCDRDKVESRHRFNFLFDKADRVIGMELQYEYAEDHQREKVQVENPKDRFEYGETDGYTFLGIEEEI